MNGKRIKLNEKGLTLVEILLGVVILSLLFSIAFLLLSGWSNFIGQEKNESQVRYEVRTAFIDLKKNIFDTSNEMVIEEIDGTCGFVVQSNDGNKYFLTEENPTGETSIIAHILSEDGTSIASSHTVFDGVTSYQWHNEGQPFSIGDACASPDNMAQTFQSLTVDFITDTNKEETFTFSTRFSEGDCEPVAVYGDIVYDNVFMHIDPLGNNTRLIFEQNGINNLQMGPEFRTQLMNRHNSRVDQITSRANAFRNAGSNFEGYEVINLNCQPENTAGCFNEIQQRVNNSTSNAILIKTNSNFRFNSAITLNSGGKEVVIVANNVEAFGPVSVNIDATLITQNLVLQDSFTYHAKGDLIVASLSIRENATHTIDISGTLYANKLESQNQLRDKLVTIRANEMVINGSIKVDGPSKFEINQDFLVGRFDFQNDQWRANTEITVNNGDFISVGPFTAFGDIKMKVGKMLATGESINLQGSQTDDDRTVSIESGLVGDSDIVVGYDCRYPD